jgi:hypothetical protein
VICRTLAEIEAAAQADAARHPPISQETADLVAAILYPHRPARELATAP